MAKIIDVTKTSGKKATVMVKFDDGSMGAAEILYGVADVPRAQAVRSRLELDAEAAKVLHTAMSGKIHLEIDEMVEALSGMSVEEEEE